MPKMEINALEIDHQGNYYIGSNNGTLMIYSNNKLIKKRKIAEFSKKIIKKS